MPLLNRWHSNCKLEVWELKGLAGIFQEFVELALVAYICFPEENISVL